MHRPVGRLERILKSRLWLEELEVRLTPSSSHLGSLAYPHAFALPAGVSSNTLFKPSQLRHAYGVDQVLFGSIHGDGTGQTIALVDAYNNPNVASDLAAFDSANGISAPPSFKIVNQSGGSTLPTNDVGWGLEEDLDVQYAHGMAPKASIILVEAFDNSFSNLFNAVSNVRKMTSVSVVSMSFGGSEFAGETVYDSVFSTPVGHKGISFVASAGDSGAIGQFPSASPNILSIGGTSLFTDAHGNYQSESTWSGGGGGPSTIELQPAYQTGFQSTGFRGTPDVSLVADPATGVSVYDTFGYSGFVGVGGTSLSAPSWAGILAIANQGRAINGLNTLTNLPGTIYSLPASDFHDITTGSNGQPAGPGYDFATGRGTPIGNLLIPDLVATVSGAAVVQHGTPGTSVPGSSKQGNRRVIASPVIFAIPTPVVTTIAVTSAPAPSQLKADISTAMTQAALAPAPARPAFTEAPIELAHGEDDSATMPLAITAAPATQDRGARPDGAGDQTAVPTVASMAGENQASSILTVLDAQAGDHVFADWNASETVAIPAAESTDGALSPVAIAGLMAVLGGGYWRMNDVRESDRRQRPLLRV